MRIWLGNQSVDMRVRGFDGLAEQVRQHLQADPLSGHVFVFRNKRAVIASSCSTGTEDGFVIVYKRLERGTFRWPARNAPGQQKHQTASGRTDHAASTALTWQTARRAHGDYPPAGDGVRMWERQEHAPFFAFLWNNSGLLCV